MRPIQLFLLILFLPFLGSLEMSAQQAYCALEKINVMGIVKMVLSKQ